MKASTASAFNRSPGRLPPVKQAPKERSIDNMKKVQTPTFNNNYMFAIQHRENASHQISRLHQKATPGQQGYRN